MDIRTETRDVFTNSADVETAWAAGFYEGEGCIVAVTRTGALMFSIAQVNREPLERFAAWAQCGIVRSTKDGSIHIYRLHGADAQRVVMDMWNHLSKRRQDQALKALLRYVMRRVNQIGCRRGHSPNVGFYVDPRGRRECLRCRDARREGPLPPFVRPRAIDLGIGVRQYAPLAQT